MTANFPPGYPYPDNKLVLLHGRAVNRLMQAVFGMRGINIGVSHNADGILLSTDGGGTAAVGDAAVPARVTGAPSAGVYPVDLYADGKGEDSTGSDNLEILNLNLTEVLPVGTWVLAHVVDTLITGEA